MTHANHPYDALTPDTIIDAIESTGLLTDMRLLALNSYENRVYQVGLEEHQPDLTEFNGQAFIIAKFYRPGRWNAHAIIEEHTFTQELQEEELPVVAPLEIHGKTLFEHKGFYFALFPRKSGHSPEISDNQQLNYLGRWLARLHQIGQDYRFQHRPVLNGKGELGQRDQISLIRQSMQTVLNADIMDNSYIPAYESLCQDLEQTIQQQYQPEPHEMLRLHGDAHVGNLIVRDEQFWLVDFDDCLQGPAMQDIWMLLSGQREEQQSQLEAIREGYEMFRPFPAQQLKWIESLRTLRLIKHAAWLAERWSDPAFPLAFPWFTSARYWSEHILSLREQQAALQELPLQLHY